MNNDLMAAVEYLHKERGIDREVVLQALESALVHAAQKADGAGRKLRISVDRETLDIKAFARLVVVEHARDCRNEISISRAREIKADVQIGEEIEVEVPRLNLGRIPAQTAKQMILQRIRQAERDLLFAEYKDRVNDIVTGTVRRFERGDVIVDLGKCESVMPARERVPTEEYQVGDRIRGLLLSVESEGGGLSLILSRAHPDFVKRLFALEVSEVADKTVEIKAIAREPGYRTKIAVHSNDEKVDPVGACVGMRGGRVKNIVRELGGEKVDIIRWDPNIRVFVTNALQPAKLKRVEIDEAHNRVKIIVDPDQLSLAIGKRGQNARLTAKLTGWKIDIESDTSATMAFEEQVARAIEALTAVDGIDKATAEQLVRHGFATAEGILAAEVGDIAEVPGIGPEKAQVIVRAVKAHVARNESPAAAAELTAEQPRERTS